MIRPALAIGLLAASFAAVTGSALAQPRSLSITVVGSQPDDVRWAAVDEAVAFWNEELERAGAAVRLGPVSRRVEPPPEEMLRQFSKAIVGVGNTGFPSDPTPVPGDIVVMLSDSDLISFAIPWGRERKGLVGMRRADIPPLSMPNVLRNVTAHEIGHALGLVHNSDPANLMCGRPAPCRPPDFAAETPRFFPLTASDRASLRFRLW